MHTTPCRVCGQPATVCKQLKASAIAQALTAYFNEAPPADAVADYTLYRCGSCSFEFVGAGSANLDSFYNWVTRQPGYYPDDRWEWSSVKAWLHTQQRPLRLLEIGCGDGRFLDQIRSLPQLELWGLDTTPYAIEACNKKGYHTFLGTAEAFLEAQPQQAFDAIVSFHCLEHIAYPLSIMQTLQALLAPGGSIFVSTPYSPMVFEKNWYDPLNHPPHHYGRWNVRAYNALAQALGMQVQYKSAPPESLTYRVRRQLTFARAGAAARFMQPKPLRHFLRRPLQLLGAYGWQYRRDTINGAAANDVVLVHFTQSV